MTSWRRSVSTITQSGFQKRSETVVVCVEPDLRARLERAARENERSLSAEVRRALRRHLEEPVGAGR
jgi:hypothetical protein